MKEIIDSIMDEYFDHVFENERGMIRAVLELVWTKSEIVTLTRVADAVKSIEMIDLGDINEH